MSRKRAKAEGLCVSDVDADEVLGAVEGSSTSNSKPILSYAAMLRNIDAQVDMEEEVEFSDADCCYSPGKHGLNLTFSERVDAALDRPWRYAVIVKLMGKPNSVSSYEFILRGLRRKWKSHGGWRLVDLVNNYFIVKFELEQDMQQALCGGPWILAGQTLVVRRWSASFNPLTDRVGSMAVWVRVLGLPVRFFTEFSMSKIGKLLGEVVKVDEITLKQERGRYARVCVEVDLGKPFLPVVEVNGVEYGVQYEGLSMICFSCGMYGHSKDKCHTNLGVASGEATMEPVGPDPAVPVEVPACVEVPVSDVEPGFGPWMLMEYKNGRKAGKSNIAKKEVAQQSRFAVLQEDGVTMPQVDVPRPDAAMLQSAEGANNSPKSKPVAEIIQMWSCLQSKIKERSMIGSGFALDATSNACDISGAASMNAPLLAKVNGAVRVPLLDLSNSSRSNGKKGAKNVRRNMEGPSMATGLCTSGKQLFPDSADLSKVNFAGFYGRSPPEKLLTDNKASCGPVGSQEDVVQLNVSCDGCVDLDVSPDGPSVCEGLSMDI